MKTFRGSPGRCLPRNMLLAIVEKFRQKYRPLLEGAFSSQPMDWQLLSRLAFRQAKSRRPMLKNSGLVVKYLVC